MRYVGVLPYKLIMNDNIMIYKSVLKDTIKNDKMITNKNKYKCLLYLTLPYRAFSVDHDTGESNLIRTL